MKQILFYLLLCCGIVFAACDSDNVQEKKDIRLGTDNITEVSLNKLSTRTIILSGGTGKYMANVADSKVAEVKISKDTLRISGIWEGSFKKSCPWYWGGWRNRVAEIAMRMAHYPSISQR